MKHAFVTAWKRCVGTWYGSSGPVEHAMQHRELRCYGVAHRWFRALHLYRCGTLTEHQGVRLPHMGIVDFTRTVPCVLPGESP